MKYKHAVGGAFFMHEGWHLVWCCFNQGRVWTGIVECTRGVWGEGDSRVHQRCLGEAPRLCIIQDHN